MENCNHNFEFIKEEPIVAYGKTSGEAYKTVFVVMCKKCGLVKTQDKYLPATFSAEEVI